jgi:drug/metabolite transporter (DMT)-like permease
MAPRAELYRKSALFAVLAICTNAGGNFLLSRGMHVVGPTVGVSPLAYLSVLRNPFVDAGVACLAAWLLSQLSLLSWADLSYVLPITATAYALTAVAGWLGLGEHVSDSRWAGIFLITAGAILVGRTIPRTTPSHPEEDPE